MHEVSLVRALLEQVEAIRRQNAGAQVVGIAVSVGEFAGVEPALFQSAFDQLIGETRFPEARLELRRVPLRVRCRACGRTSAVANLLFCCAHCHDRSVEVEAGDGLILETVRLEA